MNGERQPLTIPLQGFWSPAPSKPRRIVDALLGGGGESDTPENAWEELVHWFEQQREWAELAASFEAAAAG